LVQAMGWTIGSFCCKAIKKKYFFFFLTFMLAPFQIHSQLKESIHLSIHMPTGNPAVKEKLHCLVTLDRLTIRVARCCGDSSSPEQGAL
jgi:hypothetical protein